MFVTINKGFTLVELIITIAIASILITIAAPSYQSLVVQSRLSTQANQLATSFHYARSEAIKRGMRVTVCKSSNGATCVDADSWQDGWIVFSDGGTTGTVDAGTDQLLRVFDGLKGSTLNGGSSFGNFISYQPNGRSRNGTFSLCNSSHGRSIVINISGRLSVRDVPSC